MPHNSLLEKLSVCNFRLIFFIQEYADHYQLKNLLTNVIKLLLYKGKYILK